MNIDFQAERNSCFGSRSSGITTYEELLWVEWAGSLWSQLLRDKLGDVRFKQSLSNSCLYSAHDTSAITVLVLYVYGILVTRRRFEESSRQSILFQVFQSRISDPAEESIVAMRVRYRENHGYSFNQEPSICELKTKMGPDEVHLLLTSICQDYGYRRTSNLHCLEMRSFKKLTSNKLQTLACTFWWFPDCSRSSIRFTLHKLMIRTHAPTTTKEGTLAAFHILIMWRVVSQERAYLVQHSVWMESGSAGHARRSTQRHYGR